MISSFLETIALRMYEEIRPLLLDTQQIEILTDIIRMVKMEIVAGEVVKRSEWWWSMIVNDSQW